jgi:hypothetical protein
VGRRVLWVCAVLFGVIGREWAVVEGRVDLERTIVVDLQHRIAKPRWHIGRVDRRQLRCSAPFNTRW